MGDSEMEWKTRPVLGAQRIYLQQQVADIGGECQARKVKDY
jgi:hypothetical protein